MLTYNSLRINDFQSGQLEISKEIIDPKGCGPGHPLKNNDFVSFFGVGKHQC